MNVARLALDQFLNAKRKGYVVRRIVSPLAHEETKAV